MAGDQLLLEVGGNPGVDEWGAESCKRGGPGPNPVVLRGYSAGCGLETSCSGVTLDGFQQVRDSFFLFGFSVSL